MVVVDIGKMITEYKKLQDKTQYTPDDKIHCFKNLMNIQENYKLTEDTSLLTEYKKEYERCVNIIK